MSAIGFKGYSMARTRMIYPRGGILYTDVYVTEGGQRNRKRVSTGFKIGQEAQAMIVAARLQAGESVVVTPGVGASVLTLGEATKAAWTKWATLKDARHKAGIGREALAYFGEALPLHQLDAARIQKWAEHLQASAVTGATINRKLAWVSALLRFHLNAGALQAMPRIPKFRETPLHRKPLTPTEVEAIICAETVPEFQDLLVFLRDTGCRVSEALGLQWSEVGRGVVTFADTKAGDNRTLPLTDAAAAALARAFDRGARVPFPMRYELVQRRFRAAAMRAGVEVPDGSALHLLRHSTATALLDRGVGVRHVQAWLGHKTVTTTERYAKVTGASLVGVMERMQNQ